MKYECRKRAVEAQMLTHLLSDGNMREGREEKNKGGRAVMGKLCVTV